MTNYHFDIYNEANRINGNIAVEFTAIANSESISKNEERIINNKMKDLTGYKEYGYTHVHVLEDATGILDFNFFKSKKSAEKYCENKTNMKGSIYTLKQAAKAYPNDLCFK